MATPVTQDDGLRAACAEAVEELRAARKLLASQGLQIEKQDELLALEHQLSDGLKNLRTLDAAEKDQLRKALADKDRVIEADEAEIAALKKQRWTWWKKAKAIGIGIGIGVAAGMVIANK